MILGRLPSDPSLSTVNASHVSCLGPEVVLHANLGVTARTRATGAMSSVSDGDGSVLLGVVVEVELAG
jgi:hypothetical protein